MKKFLSTIAVIAVLFSSIIALTACSGYSIEGRTTGGADGEKIFFEAKYNEEYKLEDGVKMEFNFAHEKTAETEIPYSIYVLKRVPGSVNAESIYALPLDFASNEKYKAKNVKKEEIVPGVFNYNCTFPQKAIEVTLPAEIFEGESGTFSLALANSDTDFTDETTLCALEFEYIVSNGTVIFV